jgi:hypothetical protein
MPGTPRKPHWLRFNLRSILFWITPYLALGATILAWRGPYRSEFLNQHARWTLFLFWSGAWTTLFLRAHIRKSRENS